VVFLTGHRNYTGDILNFGLAKERYSAKHPDRAALLRFVVVADDVAVGKTQGAIVGRRGLAGTVLVYKIASALARKGGSLDQVEQLALCIAERVGTVGIGLGHCHASGKVNSLEQTHHALGARDEGQEHSPTRRVRNWNGWGHRMLFRTS